MFDGSIVGMAGRGGAPRATLAAWLVSHLSLVTGHLKDKGLITRDKLTTQQDNNRAIQQSNSRTIFSISGILSDDTLRDVDFALGDGVQFVFAGGEA